MTIGSMFDGSGTAPLAASMLGGTPVWASEIEPYPIAVTRARFPKMKHLGDITRINGAEVAPVDIIVGGSPCQDLSVAGKQAGLEAGTRSNLFYEMTRIIREMRGATNGKYPRFVVWENVPGAFSSNKGRDFLSVVEAFCAIADDSVHIPEPEKDAKTGRLAWKNAGTVVGDGWSFGWRVLDAQFWGVPQRRRRIFAVLDLGSERAGEILFERTRLPWDSEPRGEAGQGTPADVVGCADRGGGVRCLNPHDSQTMRVYDADGIYPALAANSGGGQNRQAVIYPVGAFCAGAAPAAGSIGYSERVAPTLKAAQCAFPMPAIVYAIQGNGIDRALTAGCNGPGWREGEMYTLNTIDRPAVVYDARGNLVVEHRRRYVVRRLTPTECARLQGFPDWWTDGVPGSDSAKYKMWGNGMALPCMLALLNGIKEAMIWGLQS